MSRIVAIVILLPLITLAGCDSATRPATFPAAFTLVRYNGSALPYSGMQQIGPGSPDDPTHCYEVLSGKLSMRNGIYSVRVEGRENQFCETGWTYRVLHAGTERYDITGDSIEFRMTQGLGARPSGYISGDTVVMVLRPVPAAAGYGERTLTFAPE